MQCAHCARESKNEFCPPCQESRAAARILYETAEKTFILLYARWREEYGYEDIRDYQAPLQTYFNAVGATDVVITAKPVGFRCHIKGIDYIYHIKDGGYAYFRRHVTIFGK